MQDFYKIMKKKSEDNGIKLNDEQIKLFEIYLENLMDWNSKINLTAIRNENDILVKHFIDSIIINDEIDGKKIMDIGSGPGFPGIPLKIMDDNREVVLVDSVGKKVNFMNDSIEKMGLSNIVALHERAEELAHMDQYREKFDVVTSRAVANMTTLVEYMLPFVKVGGKCVCLKGPDLENELEDAKKAIKILGGVIERVSEYSLEDNRRTLVVISKVKNTEQTYPRKQGKPLKEPIR